MTAARTSMDPAVDTAPSSRASKTQDAGTLDLFGPTHQVEVRAHLRTVPGAAPATGAERRDVALEAMSEKDAVRLALDYVREKLVALYKSRQNWMPQDKHYCTADDADRIWLEWSRFPDEIKEANANWRGATFLSKGWKRIPGRTIRSTRDRMHATDLALWRWEGE